MTAKNIPQPGSTTRPSEAVVEAYRLGRQHGLAEAQQRPCVPVGRQSPDMPIQERLPSASVPDGQPERQPGAGQGPRKTKHTTER